MKFASIRCSATVWNRHHHNRHNRYYSNAGRVSTVLVKYCCALVLSLLTTATWWPANHPGVIMVTGEVIGPFPNGVPGSGYGCENTCNDGDVNYVIRASLQTYTVPGSSDAEGFAVNETLQNGDVAMYTRTFQGVADESAPFCLGMDGNGGPLGPCIRVKRGQSVRIKLVNDMENGMELLQQHKAELDEYWRLVKEPGQPDLDSIDWFGPTPPTPQEMKITNPQDLPGWDATFDDVNIHLHGMQVVPHLFYPQGTGNPSAEWITVQPVNENPEQQCFCYVFQIPEDHPQGTFFYHIHRHGAVAMQAWQGMVGYLLVGDEASEGSPDMELAQQGITRDEPFALWEWAVNPNNRIANSNTWFEGNFIEQDDGNVLTTFLTNDDYQPTFNMCVNETVHFRLLCAQTTTGSALYISGEDNAIIPFYVFASDGISYDRAYWKQSIVVGPGQREGLLLQFQKPGRYRIMQGIINDYQGSGEAVDDDDPAAYILVSSENCTTSAAVDLSSLKFTPGMARNVSIDEVTTQISVNFQVQSLKDRAPVPQFVIDGKEFDYKRISHTMNATSSSQWTLTSNMNYFHPFHIHVNPFQVQSMYSGILPGAIGGQLSLKASVINTNMEPGFMWRDTVFVPPFGVTTILQRFGDSTSWSGKSVYHCHFLDHEDQGMIAAMIIADPSASVESTDLSEAVDVADSSSSTNGSISSTSNNSTDESEGNVDTQSSDAAGISINTIITVFTSVAVILGEIA